MNKLKGYQVLSGGFGTLHWNGEPIFEVKKVDAKVKINREQVPSGIDMDSKMTSLEGEGSFTINHVYTRGIKMLLDAYKKGMDVRSTLSVANNDPDIVGRQRERVNLSNVWFNEIMIANFARGELVEKEFPYGFTPSDAILAEIIN